jgi:hypothetical protein
MGRVRIAAYGEFPSNPPERQVRQELKIKTPCNWLQGLYLLNFERFCLRFGADELKRLLPQEEATCQDIRNATLPLDSL